MKTVYIILYIFNSEKTMSSTYPNKTKKRKRKGKAMLGMKTVGKVVHIPNISFQDDFFLNVL